MRPPRPTSSLYALGAAVACSLAVPASAAARIPEPASWQPLPLELRVIQQGEFLDLVPVARSLLAAGGAGQRSQIDVRAGFRRALIERLSSPTTGVKAVSVVVEL